MLEVRDLSKEIVFLSIPAVSEMFLYMLLWVVDTAMVGNYGGQVSVSAVGISSEIVYTITTIFVEAGIAVGVTSLVARNVGAGRDQDASGYIAHGLMITAVLGLLVSSFLFFFAEHILMLFKVEKDVLTLGTGYLHITSIGAFFVVQSFILSGGLRGTGDTRTPLKIAFFVNIINILLDYLLIFGNFCFPELGVRGAAIATTTAQVTGLCLLIFFYRYRTKISLGRKNFFPVSIKRIKDIVGLSIPAALQEGAFSSGRLATLFFIMQMGTLSFAVNQITTTIESISFMPGYGFAIAATTLVGQNIGAGNPEKAEKAGWLSMLIGVAAMSLVGLIFLTVPYALVSLFIKSPAAISLGALCVRIAAIEQPFVAVSMVLGGALKGAGDTKSPFAVSLVSSWVVRIPLVYTVVFVLHLGVAYVWLVFAVQFLVEAVLIIFIFRKGRWKTLSKEN